MPAKKKPAAAAAATAAKSTAVALRPPTTVALPGSWRDRAKQSINASRQQLAKLPAMGGNFLSFRGGVISFGGNQIANPLPIILLAHGFERTYYSKPFNPDVAETPDCYSYDGDKPHEKASVPQADACAQCRFAEFGSAPNGKGKACREGSRLAFIHADTIEKGVAAVASAPILQARLSVLNAKTFRSYVENCFGDDKPTWAVITMLTNQPDPKSQYATTFMPVVLDGGDPVLDAIAARVDEAEKLMLMPYPEYEDAPQQKPATPPRRRKF